MNSNSLLNFVPRFKPFGEWAEWMLSSIGPWDRTEAGRSSENKPIYLYRAGHGPRILLGWAQMHGNEPTATNALLALFQEELPKEAQEKCTFYFLPLLNPDGADRFTRENASGLDINRDARECATPEAQILIKLLERIKPDLCLNLHDQRVTFRHQNTSIPATFSILSPRNHPTDLDNSFREISKIWSGFLVDKISAIHPAGCTSFSDEFYPSAFGELIQEKYAPIVLIETGAFSTDYNRTYQARVLSTVLHALLVQFSEIPAEEYLRRYTDLEPAETGLVDLLLLSEKSGTGVALSLFENTEGIYYEIMEVGDVADCPAITTIYCEEILKGNLLAVGQKVTQWSALGVFGSV